MTMDDLHRPMPLAEDNPVDLAKFMHVAERIEPDWRVLDKRVR